MLMQSESLSIVQRSLGEDFKRLHPQIQQQYGITSESNAAYIGSGVMEKVWNGKWFMIPFLHLGALHRILFPETGENIPFDIQNYAYKDSFGRETITWYRAFQFPKRKRHFDEYFVYSEKRNKPFLYAGTHQHLSVDLVFEVEEDGSLIVKTGSQRLLVGPLSIPFPQFFSGDAYVKETYNDDLGHFEVDVKVSNWFWGNILGYNGIFDLKRIDCTREQIPEDVIPIREKSRE